MILEIIAVLMTVTSILCCATALVLMRMTSQLLALAAHFRANQSATFDEMQEQQRRHG